LEGNGRYKQQKFLISMPKITQFEELLPFCF
jgi:hypothetical protein